MHVFDGAEALAALDLQYLTAVIEVEFLFSHHGQRFYLAQRVNGNALSVAHRQRVFIDAHAVARELFLAFEFDAFAEQNARVPYFFAVQNALDDLFAFIFVPFENAAELLRTDGGRNAEILRIFRFQPAVSAGKTVLFGAERRYRAALRAEIERPLYVFRPPSAFKMHAGNGVVHFQTVAYRRKQLLQRHCLYLFRRQNPADVPVKSALSDIMPPARIGAVTAAEIVEHERHFRRFCELGYGFRHLPLSARNGAVALRKNADGALFPQNAEHVLYGGEVGERFTFRNRRHEVFYKGRHFQIENIVRGEKIDLEPERQREKKGIHRGLMVA